MESGIQPVKFSKKVFGNDFAWGVSTAAFQTEGACTESGKGLSIWDVFTKRKGKILNAGNADTACDFYNQYEKDIDLIKAMNIPNFRFSISWTRILPAGAGTVNQEGIAHYNKVIAYCLQHGIEPWITLYHWDLPQELELKGGWTNREIITWFSDFVAICAKAFGDRVKHWMVMNEPGVFTGAGYFLGIHAPGRTGLKNYSPCNPVYWRRGTKAAEYFTGSDYRVDVFVFLHRAPFG
jgi:beta-glucosidase